MLPNLGDAQGALASYQRATALLDSVVKTRGEWADRLQLSTTLMRGADILWSLGKHDESLAAYRRALAIQQALVKAGDADAALKVELGHNYNNVGDLLAEVNHFDEAEQYYGLGAAIAESHLAQEPQNVNYQADVAVSYDRRGDIQWSRGRWEDALQSIGAHCRSASDSASAIRTMPSGSAM